MHVREYRVVRRAEAEGRCGRDDARRLPSVLDGLDVVMSVHAQQFDSPAVAGVSVSTPSSSPRFSASAMVNCSRTGRIGCSGVHV